MKINILFISPTHPQNEQCIYIAKSWTRNFININIKVTRGVERFLPDQKRIPEQILMLDYSVRCWEVGLSEIFSAPQEFQYHFIVAGDELKMSI